MTQRARLLLVPVLAMIAAFLVPAARADAAPVVVAGDLTAGPSVNLISFTNDPSTPFSSLADGFDIYQRGVSPSIPFAVLDDSVSFSSDSLGIIQSGNTAPFFGVSDTVNDDTTSPVAATWEFDISGATDLTLSIDVGAMGDFESADLFAWTYSIDGGPAAPAFSLTVDEAASRSYTLESGSVFTLDDPMNVGTIELSNVLQTVTVPLAGSGSTLALTLTAQTDGGSETAAFQNIVIMGETGGTGSGDPVPGDLVITEVMQNPSAVGDNAGEWFEIQNVSASDIDIDGWTIGDLGSDTHTIANGGPLVVPAGGFVVLGNNIDTLANGGVAVDYSYGGSWFLANGDDEIVLTDPAATVFDTILYDGGPVWPDPNGASMSLSADQTSAVANDDGGNWCEAVTPYGDGDLGTPGAANPNCDDDPPPPVDTVFIHEIQGAGPSVAITAPVVVEAVVTSLFERDDVLDGFFIQEEDADADTDPATSEGIFVFCRGICPSSIAVGDLVTLGGTPTDFFGMSQIELAAGSFSVISSGNALPTAATLSMPAAGSTQAEATFENIEGMVITIPDTMVVSEYFEVARYGQVVLTENSRPYQFTHSSAPSPGGYDAFLADLATRRIILDDDNNDNNDAISDGPDEPYFYADTGLSLANKYRGGDTITGLTGVLHWSFAGTSGTDAWRIRPIDGVPNVFTSVNPAPAAPPAVGGTLTVASFNVLNYFATVDNNVDICAPSGTEDCRGADSDAELVRQREKIVSAMAAMDADVIGIIEVQNDTDQSTAELVTALNALVGPGTYDYIVTGFIGTDAIKVGLIYQPASVTPVGDFAILDSTVDPTFLDDKNRPVLIQTFDEVATGERFTVAVNHLKSKGSPCDDVGDPDLMDGQASCPNTRTAAAIALANYLATDPTGSGDPDTLIIGDLNAYAMEDPIMALIAAGFTDLLNLFGGSSAYSYVFDGQLGYLDHALANPALLDQVTGTAAWAINADEVNVFDYNDDIGDAGEQSFERESGVLPIYAGDPFRSSDHDPVLVGLTLDSIPDNPECFGVPATIVGTAGPDQIFGTNGPDVIVTFGGDDYIDSGNGEDLICSGSGSDEIHAGNGKDTVDAGPGDDTIWGDNGKDSLDGGDGFDTIDGGNAKDECLNGESLNACEA